VGYYMAGGAWEDTWGAVTSAGQGAWNWATGNYPVGVSKLLEDTGAPGPNFLSGGGNEGRKGYHLAKDGSGEWVKNRYMNPLNPRALRRSMRRVQGFARFARKTISFTQRHKLKKGRR
jgi:hypothetical protein